MQYKTIVLELLRERTELHEQLRLTRRLLPTLDTCARELKASHETWKETLARANPQSDPSQISSEAMEMALRELEEQADRLARAELRALRAQISPHFIYNAMAAIASYIHSNPDEARELLTDFAEFTRYAFRTQRPYVTLADELHYVERYLRLEQARFQHCGLTAQA